MHFSLRGARFLQDILRNRADSTGLTVRFEVALMCSNSSFGRQVLFWRCRMSRADQMQGGTLMVEHSFKE